MATIRLGKRTDKQSPLIRNFVPLTSLDQLVFGAWDPIPDNCYEAAVKCGVLDRYYELRGWTKEGLPTTAKLREPGLHFVLKDMPEKSE